MQAQNVCIVGNGYVGLPLAVLMKQQGHTVIGFEADPRKVLMLNSGKSPVEDVADDQLEGLTFTLNPADIEECDVYVICVPTPTTKERLPDLKYVCAVRDTLSKHAKPGSLVILESTVGVGDTKRVFADMVQRGFRVANSPERIDPGRTFPLLKDIPKVVGGVDEESGVIACAFYETVFSQVVAAKNSDHSEAVKLLENSYRAVNITFINEMESFARNTGLDIHNIIDAAATKPYGFTKFVPGVGVGGHCIPEDAHFLMHSVKGQRWPVLDTVMRELHARPARLARERVSPDVTKALVIGVSYKPNVADCRESPQEYFLQELVDSGIDAAFYDPYVAEFHGFKKVEDIRVDDWDKIFVCHEHDCLDLSGLRALPNVEFLCR